MDAIQRTASGAVVVDADKCIGCGTYAIVCPFGVPRVSEKTHKVLKCDLCDDLVVQGREPVCVASCPKGALVFGDYGEPLKARRLRLASSIKESLVC